MNIQEPTLAPHSVELEEAVLGSILMNPECLTYDNVKALKPTDFYLLKNQRVFDAIAALYGRGESVDNITVIEELKRAPEQFAEIGGAAYITYLINSTPTYFHADTYAAVVRSAARRRQALDIASQIAQAAVNDQAEDFEAQFRHMERILAERNNQSAFTNYLVHVSELKNLPQVTWLIPGEIPERGLIVLFGPSGVGKSFVALDYAMRLAGNTSVVYVAAEGETGYLLRVSAWCKHHNVDDQSLNLHFYMNIVSLLDPTERKVFAETIRQVNPRFVVIDTLALCLLPGDENSTRDMGLFVKASKELRTALDCAVMLVHHTGKEGKQERGNSALRAASDVMIRLIGEDDIIRMECSKTKDATSFPTRYVRLLPVETEYGSSPVIIESDKVIGSKDDAPSLSQRKILETLTLEIFEGGAASNELLDHTDLTRPTLYRAISQLVKYGHIQRDNDTKAYRITDQGRSLIAKESHESHSVSPESHASLTGVSPHGDNESHCLTQKNTFSPKNGHSKTRETRETHETRETRTLSFGKPKPKNVCHRCKQDCWQTNPDGSWYCAHCREKDEQDRRIFGN